MLAPEDAAGTVGQELGGQGGGGGQAGGAIARAAWSAAKRARSASIHARCCRSRMCRSTASAAAIVRNALMNMKVSVLSGFVEPASPRVERREAHVSFGD